MRRNLQSSQILLGKSGEWKIGAESESLHINGFILRVSPC